MSAGEFKFVNSSAAISATDAVLTAVAGPSYELTKIIVQKILKAKTDVSDGDQLPEVRIQTERQENEMRRLEAQAKVAQEMAISDRIRTASEVQIEEYYEYAGEGKFGLHSDGSNAGLGASGAGKRISKRVYKFTGSLAHLDVTNNVMPSDIADQPKE